MGIGPHSSFFIFYISSKDNSIYSLLALSLFLYFTRCLLLLTVYSSRYWGKLSWYDGSGYIAEISNDTKTQLESSSWIDRRFVLNVTFVAYIQSVVLELIIMVAVCNRADHYIFALWFLLSFFFLFSSPNLSGGRLDVYHTSSHGVALV